MSTRLKELHGLADKAFPGKQLERNDETKKKFATGVDSRKTDDKIRLPSQGRRITNGEQSWEYDKVDES